VGGRALILISAIVGVVALTGHVRPVNVLAYSLAATLVIALAWSFASVRGLYLRREPFESHLQVGQTLRERVTLTNRTIVPHLWLELADESTLPDHVAGSVVELGPRESRTWVARTVCTRRGEFFLGPTTFVGADPLGFFPRRRTVGTTKRVLVYPQTIALPAFELPVNDLVGGDRRRGMAGQTSPHAAEVREYYPGDPLNRIHWQSTARAQRLMVKEFDRDPSADLWLFLDFDASVQRGEGNESTEEYAVRIAASVARIALEQHVSVGLVAGCCRTCVLPADRGDRQLLKMLEALAVARADGTEPFAEVLAAEGLRCGRNAVILAITPSTDESWVNGLRELKLRGIGAAAITLEAATFGQPKPGDPAATSADPGARNPLFLVGALASSGLRTWSVKRGDVLSEALRGNGKNAVVAARVG
jgi:uncharacterized protein (DUF58 family)